MLLTPLLGTHATTYIRLPSHISHCGKGSLILLTAVLSVQVPVFCPVCQAALLPRFTCTCDLLPGSLHTLGSCQ